MYKRIVNMTFLPVFENKDAIIKALLIPLMAIIVLTKFSMIYYEDSTIRIVISSIIFLLNVLIAITTHRILILGKTSVPIWGITKFTKREFSFVINSVIIALIVGACMAVGIAGVAMKLPEAIAIPLLISAAITALMLFSRLSLVLPSIAINAPITLKEAWNLTRNHKMLTFFTIVFFPLAITLVVGVLYTLVIKFLMGVISEHFNMFYPVLDVFLTVFIVSALSATYRFIQEQQPNSFKAYDLSKEMMQEDDSLDSNEVTLNEEVVEELEQEVRQEITKPKEIIIALNNEEFTVNLDEFPVSFSSIKRELITQYEDEGLTNIVVNKEDAYIAQHPENEQIYVALQKNPDGFSIETNGVKEVDLNENMREKINNEEGKED